jgi:transposase
VGRACWWLAPLHELVLSTVLTSPKVFADDTTLPVLDPGRGRTKTGRLWCYAVDNRPWRGPGHPAAAYVYSEDRKGEHPATHLKGFRGLLQVDGYAGFGRLVADMGNVSQLAFCWAHARRKFYDIYAATQSSLAGEALRQIAALYEIETRSVASPPTNADGSASSAVVHSSRRCRHGWRTRSAASPVVPRWPRRSATR